MKREPIKIVSHDLEHSGVRTYDFTSGLKAMEFISLFKGKLVGYDFKIVNGEEFHIYTVTI